MAEFTPGPWEYHGPSTGKNVSIDDGGDYAITVNENRSGKKLIIAEAFRRVNYTVDAPVLANAALIAAAPELYEQLASVSVLIDLLVDGEISKHMKLKNALHAQGKIQAALARARGEQND